jgi:hypothetical protein
MVSSWLSLIGFPANKEIYLSWNEDMGMITNWGMLLKYFDDFAYLGADDLTVFDPSFGWALLFFHNCNVYFGSTIALTK